LGAGRGSAHPARPLPRGAARRHAIRLRNCALLGPPGGALLYGRARLIYDAELMASPSPAPTSTLALGVGRRTARLGIADLALAALVILVVGLMVVPLPTALLDLLIASNLAFSVVLLLVSLYASDALKIAAFPTVLLVTTLVRLALNVSATRLILLQADAGEVIRAFGNFVVRGNYVVGGVVFAILSIIQFVVIAKGSERVAEVGARFTLDAMPGKQMAIDAELRSGAIDGNEARARRHALARESQFYGAM